MVYLDCTVLLDLFFPLQPLNVVVRFRKMRGSREINPFGENKSIETVESKTRRDRQPLSPLEGTQSCEERVYSMQTPENVVPHALPMPIRFIASDCTE